MTDTNAPIGVFDSGIGGLTVMKEIMHQIPDEKIIYFGDTARVPYGSKSRETVTKFSRQIVHFLESQHVKAIVVACNTASAYALDELERETEVPIIGVVKPGARVASEVTKNGKIGVIATAATISSAIYSSYIKKKNRIFSYTEIEEINVPDHALLYLKDYTRGAEERPFTYVDGKQIWW